MVDYRILHDFREIEHLRRKAFEITSMLDYFENNLKEGKMVAVGAYLDGKLIGGAYISSSMHSLYIEQLFVNKEYQHQGIGSNIVRYILNNKGYFEKYFNEKYIYSKTEPSSDEALKMLENLGYKKADDALDTMRKYI